MWGQTKQAASATTALIYITLGALIDVWSAVYYAYLCRTTPAGDNAYLWCAGLFATGLVLILIGLAVGRIGRSALDAETAPTPTQVIAPTTTPVTPVTSPAAAVMPAPAAPVVPRAATPFAQEQQPVAASPLATQVR